MKLHHFVKARRYGDTSVVTYKVSTIELRRPGQGSSVTEVHCGACGDVIVLRVHSARRTKRARRRWLGMVALALLAVAAGAFEIIRFESGHYQDPMVAVVAAPLAGIFGLAATVILTALWIKEDGVRIVAQPERGATHQLLPMVR